MKSLPLLLGILVILSSRAALAQDRGEVRISVTDPSGAGLRSQVELVSPANGYHASISTDTAGRASIPMLAFGGYRVTVDRPEFALYQGMVDVRSPLPVQLQVRLAVAAARAEVQVTGSGELVDLNSATSAMHVGSAEIEERASSLPGRSVQDLVVSQPGWLYEGNAVLHPRGSEYQTQFVLDGIPLTDNRSAGLGPEIVADDLESMSVYTAGFPAEYGRRMGGVVELNTRRQTDPGLHGSLVLSGGSYRTAQGYGQIVERRKKDSFTVSASGAHTDHFLNPVVPQNFTNTGTTANFSASYDRDLDEKSRLTASARRDLARYLIPNELVQQQAGQRQDGGNFETLGTLRYQRIVSANSLMVLSGMLRENTKELSSNRNPTPIAAFQHDRFKQGYFKATYALHHGHNEFKAGVESDTTLLHERFQYTISDPSHFDPGTAPSFTFAEDRPDLEQGAFAEDVVESGDWTASVGLRWDHYQLLLNRNAISPRLAVGRAFSTQDMVIHASYDRIFQTPSFENILLSSSPAVRAIGDNFLRLTVQPSSGNDSEIGITKGFGSRVRLDANAYWRQSRNTADDDHFLNTGVSYPISFDHSATYGVEAKLQVITAGPLTGYASYSYMVGKDWYPVTGGLFLGDAAATAANETHDHFSATQDQRNTLSTRWEVKAARRVRFAAGAGYGSGLPFEYAGTEQDALPLYGRAVVSRLNFARGRVLPWLAVNASAIAEVWRKDRLNMTLHLDGENLNNRLNVLDFGGLFSGNAIAPERSITVRLNTLF